MITPHMLRVTLGGQELAGFPDDQDGAYIKLRLREPDSDDNKPLVRTYTVRHYDEVKQELDVDFVLHDSKGPAVNWARSCQLGDSIRIGGPGPKKLVDFTADWFLIVGDMSALPAISANIEVMPANSAGYVIVEIIDDADLPALAAPKYLHLNWVVNPHPEKENSNLVDIVKELRWLAGRPSVWVAGEFSQSLAIRSFLKSERNVTRDHMYASSYWQIGKSEDGHRISKRNTNDLAS